MITCSKLAKADLLIYCRDGLKVFIITWECNILLEYSTYNIRYYALISRVIIQTFILFKATNINFFFKEYIFAYFLESSTIVTISKTSYNTHDFVCPRLNAKASNYP